MSDYGEPRKVEYISYKRGWATIISEREYIPVDQVRGTVESPFLGYGNETKFVNLTLYLDPQTGTVVWDVETYEKNLKGPNPLESIREYGE